MHFDDLKKGILETPMSQLPAILIIVIKKCMSEGVFSDIRVFIDLTIRNILESEPTKCRKCGIEVEGPPDICNNCLFPVESDEKVSKAFRSAGVGMKDLAKAFVEHSRNTTKRDESELTNGCSNCGQIRPVIRDGLCFECSEL